MAEQELALLISLKDMATSQLGNLDRTLFNFGKTAEKSSMEMGLITGGLVTFAVMAVAAAGALFGITMKVVENISQLEKLSIMTGFSVNTLQKLQYAADISNVSFETALISALFFYFDIFGGEPHLSQNDFSQHF